MTSRPKNEQCKQHRNDVETKTGYSREGAGSADNHQDNQHSTDTKRGRYIKFVRLAVYVRTPSTFTSVIRGKQIVTDLRSRQNWGGQGTARWGGGNRVEGQ